MRNQPSLIFYLFLIISCKHCFAQESSVSKAIEFLRNVLDNGNYDKAFRPLNVNNSDKPLDVDVMIDIISYGQFNPHTMKYSLLLEMEQVWYDQRLADKNGKSINDTINVSGELDKLWVPDLYFPKSLDAKLHDVTVTNSLMWLDPDGKMTYVQKLTVTLGCTLNFRRFPMDNQICIVDIGSFGFKKNDLNLRWRYGDDVKKNVILKKKKLNEFQIIRMESTSEATCGEVDDEARPCIQVKFYFRRELEYHFTHTFGPNILIVVISWLSFLIDFTVAPARVALGLISVLTIITQTNMVYSGMPKVSYIKAVDIWLVTCLAFVVGALLEFVFVNSLCRDGIKPILTVKDQIVSGYNILNKKKAEQTAGKNDIEATNEGAEETKVEQPRKKCFRFEKSTGYKIDGLCFIVYPLLFLLFNIIYWSVYLSLEE